MADPLFLGVPSRQAFQAQFQGLYPSLSATYYYCTESGKLLPMIVCSWYVPDEDTETS